MHGLARLATAGLLLITAISATYGQQPVAARKLAIKIEVGQDISAVQESLRRNGIEFSDSYFSFSKNNSDTDYLAFELAQKQSAAAVFFSKTTHNVTSIEFVTWPEGNSAKAGQAWLRARSLTLEDDGGYSVHFLPRLSDEGKKKRASVYPPAGYSK